jgi:SAM-dependent methyltransferase
MTARPTTAEETEDVGNAGERMVVGNMWGYWAHLSIYRFALPFAAGKRVLDAGSGEGYGAAYLVRHGAAGVVALDAGAEAVAHARRRYTDPRVTFDVADLNRPLPLADGAVDVVFSSNVFEHVGRVDVLAAECARVLAEDGVAIVAVPPVTSAAVMEADMQNHFHVHHLPPSAWEAKLGRFFGDVRCHGHRGSGEYFPKEREQAEIALPPDRVTIREDDFDFPPTTADALDGDADAITAVFVCREPRAEPLPETIAERTPAEWCEGEVAARLLAAERTTADELRVELAAWTSGGSVEDGADRGTAAAALRRAGVAEARAEALAARLEAVEASRIWRATGPLRSLVTALRSRA